MTSPEGEKYYGWWKVISVDEPSSFAFEDGFAADDSFTPLDDMPVSHNVYAFDPIDNGTRATFTSTYASAEGLQQVLDMAWSRARHRPSTRSTPSSPPEHRSALPLQGPTGGTHLKPPRSSSVQPSRDMFDASISLAIADPGSSLAFPDELVRADDRIGRSRRRGSCTA